MASTTSSFDMTVFFPKPLSLVEASVDSRLTNSAQGTHMDKTMTWLGLNQPQEAEVAAAVAAVSAPVLGVAAAVMAG